MSRGPWLGGESSRQASPTAFPRGGLPAPWDAAGPGAGCCAPSPLPPPAPTLLLHRRVYSCTDELGNVCEDSVSTKELNAVPAACRERRESRRREAGPGAGPDQRPAPSQSVPKELMGSAAWRGGRRRLRRALLAARSASWREALPSRLLEAPMGARWKVACHSVPTADRTSPGRAAGGQNAGSASARQRALRNEVEPPKDAPEA